MSIIINPLSSKSLQLVVDVVTAVDRHTSVKGSQLQRRIQVLKENIDSGDIGDDDSIVERLESIETDLRELLDFGMTKASLSTYATPKVDYDN